MQISVQFILMTNTYHNRFIWKHACDVKLVNPPHLSEPLLCDMPVPASQGLHNSCSESAASLQLWILLLGVNA